MCNAEFEPKSKKHKFCSTTCKEKQRPARVHKPVRATVSNICQHCGVSYFPLKAYESFSKYCSLLCLNRANSSSKRSQYTDERRLLLILDPEDEHYRNQVVFNSVERPYLPPFPRGTKMRNLARILINAPGGLDVDHINRNILDNRKENLRAVSRRLNLTNTGEYHKRNPKNEGLPKGVTKHKDRFYAKIHSRADGILTSKSLGAYTTAEEASIAYQCALGTKIFLLTTPQEDA